MSTAESLKQRIHAREPVNVGVARLGMTEDELSAALAKGPCDLLFVDAQHTPYDDRGLLELAIMANARGTGLALRIVSPRQAWLIGHFLDFGLLGVVIPQTEDPVTVDEAIAAFYYPPLGRRSWGPGRAFGFGEHREGYEYAEWWNNHGILIPQLETVAAVENCRALVKPGVDMLTFGADDLTLDLAAHPEAPFDSFEACREYVIEQTRGLDVKVGDGRSPVGRL